MRTVLGRGGRRRPTAPAGVPGGTPAAGGQAGGGDAGVGSWVSRVATATATAGGTPSAFLIPPALVAAWALSGPLFHFSDTWQLVINTSTTIATFLMVF